MIRRFGEAVVRGQTYRPRQGVYAVLLDGPDLLATFQHTPRPELQLPGGGIDPGEHPVAALHREVYEETGWHITAPRRVGTYRRFCFMPEYERWAEKICTIYVARPTLRIGPPSEAGHEAVWLPATMALTQLANTGDRAMLARALALQPR